MPRSYDKNLSQLSKKMANRRLVKKQDKPQSNMLALMETLTLNDQSAQSEFLSPVRRPDGRYVTSEATLDRLIDPKIFIETQLKRFLRWLTTSPLLFNILFTWIFIKKAGMTLAYFDQQEHLSLEKLFKEGPEHHLSDKETDQFTVHNLGHATQLIQTSGLNILTDPVFGNLAPVFYPSMTKDFGKNVRAQDLPHIDVILISHNHRDHVDVDSLKQLIKKAQNEGRDLPHVLVPAGDKDFFEGLGFTDVKAFEWHEAITLYSQTDEPVTFCSTAADHRSGRNGYDAHRSLVMGWVISPKNRNEILYFAGDTARISDTRMDSLALDIYQLFQHKKTLPKGELPRVINMEPGGPNFTRKEMKPTHQSAVDSIVSAFRLAVALHKVSSAAQEETGFTPERWLDATATVFMHQNKYELGPDRFNENVFIYERLVSYLRMSDEQLQTHAEKQNTKSSSWTLFHRRKDFIIEGVHELRQLAQQIWPGETILNCNQKVIASIRAKTHFPLINEKLSSEDVFQFEPGQVSTIIPDTFYTDKHGYRKAKGSIIEDEAAALTSPAPV
ncbi:MAG: MBL fold metallo-hydrolase [Legionellaceae bacterium]|nr:MBL fold metallo-hydrolase [Legionellaceae bacterium]